MTTCYYYDTSQQRPYEWIDGAWEPLAVAWDVSIEDAIASLDPCDTPLLRMDFRGPTAWPGWMLR